MKFLVLIHLDESAWDALTPAEHEAVLAQHAAFEREAAGLGVAILSTEPLRRARTATVLRRRGDVVTLTEGPFVETVEQLGGYYLVDAADLDAVTEACRLLPELAIEIRPVESRLENRTVENRRVESRAGR